MCCIGDETACTILSRCNSIKMIRRFDFVNKKVKNIANTYAIVSVRIAMNKYDHLQL